MSRKLLLVDGIQHAAASALRGVRRRDDDLEGFTRGEWLDDHGETRTYHRIGSGDRAVMVIHEIFGLSPHDLDFCRRLADRGFMVYAPVLFGRPGKAANVVYELRCFWRVCVSREFAALSWYRSSPIADSLRALGRDIHAKHGDPGFGVIGLCLTGNFALIMMADEHVVAPVLGEPTLPFAFSKEGRAAIGLSDDEIARAKRRAYAGCPILGYRFKEDRLCPGERFDALAETFGSAFEGHSIDSVPSGHHAVFTENYDPDRPPTRDAFERLVVFLNARL
jgi:dienelactone hydrolase